MASARTAHLVRTPDFQRISDYAPLEERIALTYRRARAIAKAYALTADDVLYLKPKFWELHMDNIYAMDGGAFTLLTIQYNLAAGTLAAFAEKRPELRPLMDQVMKFDVSAQYLLTEQAHGLDAPNLETTATLLPNGEFDLHTPHDGARKYMPPTGPFGAIPRVAVVFAKLVADGENRGIRPFIVALGDGKQTCKGVTVKLLPQRGGIKPVDHAVTSFDHVRLPSTALLGSLEKPRNLRDNFISCIWRVSVGSLALAAMAVPLLSVNAYVAARYSLRRTVTGSDGVRVPIMSFRTQQLPIMQAIAQAAVIRAHAKAGAAIYKDTSIDHRVRSGVAAAAKASMTQHAWSSLAILSERIGAHGVFEHNSVLQSELLMRGIRIAEGDVLALSIRLANELLLGRYSMPTPKHPDCLLARHEMGLFAECRALLEKVGGNHRHESLSRLLLPRCLPLVQAMGHRMAYESALDGGVDRPLVDLYESEIVLFDSAWYVERANLPRWAQFEMEDKALSAAMPHLEEYLAKTGAEPYATSPILTEESWTAFINELPVFKGNAELSLISSPPTLAPAPPVQAHL
ncbi:acyl-CoA dehydrogenase NM domain-like protein [Laetiporus sulphureus 93-53]|uniref:Acyl-CoA dehydrogenase NM domain-like protein n=1 Tax=Laetiporus sulphureus 93-53 TaxID=1314785 RepID=A0A165BG86_9APHY|nr:acyl-CoA dehydrogenase NM domain-like protein [Laetiporus sulphureus 93-53]KZT00998.1 acyl-CoA dehydrogenase NM domain-like protein [Laetiporus sulphureus 93-53]